MKRDTILFDLDGTLLPLDQDQFIKNYFGRISKFAAPHGLDPDALIAGIMAGMKDMQGNDGSQSNADAFWPGFERTIGRTRAEVEGLFRTFYETEFDKVREVLHDTVDRKPLIAQLKERGYKLVLATNPMFPIEAVRTRLGWVGLEESDFIHVTTFDNSSYCKPKKEYYEEILEKIGKAPQECIMIGNDAAEDMIAESLGLLVGLATDYLENPKELPIERFVSGTLEQVISQLT